MNSNIRKKTILKKLMKTTMFTTAIFVAFLFIGSSVAASLAGNNAATKKENTEFNELSPNIGLARINNIYGNAKDVWDLQGSVDVEAPTGSLYCAGCEAEGSLYTMEWSGSNFYEIDTAGSLVKAFTISGASSIRDLAFDGTYFYGGNSGSTIYEMDFASETLVSTIATGASVRAIAYNDDADTFYVSNWGDPVWEVDRSGGTVSQFDLGTTTSTYGFAYNDGSLWVHDQGGSGAEIHEWDIASGTWTGVMHDVNADFPSNPGSAGGLFVTDSLEPGFLSIGGFLQAAPDTIFWYELDVSGPMLDHDLALKSINEPSSGTGSVITPQVKIQNKGANDEYSIPVNMKIGNWQYIYFLNEDFESGLPGDWTVIDGGTTTDTWTDTNPSGRTPTGGCDGTFMIADSDYAGSGGILMREDLISPSFDCSGATEVFLEFSQYYKHLSSIASVDISIDGGATWINVVTQTSSTTGPTIIDVSAYAAGQADVKLDFMYDDQSAWAWYWMVDNIQVYGQTFVAEYDETINVDVPFNTTLDFAFPDWTPSDLGLAENVDIDYYCDAEIIYADNDTGNNYKDKDFTLHYGYFNDIGVTEIVSPVGEMIGGETQTPEVVVENFGQNGQSGAAVNMLIDEITYGDQWTQTQYSGDGVWERLDSSWVAPAYGSGYFMVADSDAHSSQTFDVEMFTYSMDMTGETSVDFYCAENFQVYGGSESAQIGIYSSGVLEETAYYATASDPSGGGVVNYNFDPSGYTDPANVQIGFYYSTGGTTWQWGFGIDDTLLTSATVTYIDWDFEMETFPPSEMSFTNIYDETVVFDVDSGETVNVLLPDWTPAAPLATIDYRVTACTSINVWSPVLTEGFEGYTPPSGNFPPVDPVFGPWTVVDGGTTTDTWMLGLTAPPPGGAGGYAICDTDAAGSGVTMIEDLIVPPVPHVGAPFIVEYDYDMKTWGEICEIYLSPDGITWYNPVDPVLGPWGHFSTTSGHAMWDAYAAIASLPGWPWAQVHVSWTYNNLGVWGYWYKMDNVQIMDGSGLLINEQFSVTPSSGFPPAGWTTTIYSGAGDWSGSSYGTHSHEPPGTGDDYAQARDNGVDDFDTGLFTPAIDLTGITAAKLIFERDFQDYAGYGYATVNTYSGAGMTFEEELLFLTNDDPSAGVHTELAFSPSGYTDPSEVYIEFYYNDELYNTAWGFHIDDVVIEVPVAGGDGDPSNDCMIKYITLEFLHDVGTVSIDEPTGVPVIPRDTVLYEDMEGTWIADPDGDPYMVPEDATFGAWDIDGLCVDSQAGYPELKHYISQMADYGGYGLPYEGTYCAGAWWSDGNGGDTTQDEWLKTPDMDVSEYANLELSFYGIWQWASPGDDHVYIKASTDGGANWDILADLLQDPEYEQGAGGPGGAGWCWNEYEVVIDLSAYDQSPSLIIAYQILGDPTMRAINYIDAIEITGGPAGSWEPGTYPVEATIENFGDYDENNFDVTAQISLVGADDPFYNESYTVTTVMSPGGQESIIFPDVTFTDDDEGTYTLEVTTHLIGDEVAGNDQQTLTFTIDVPDIIPPVTTHEFTGTMGDNDWYVTDVTIIITGEDDGKSPSGIKAIYYSYDNVTFEEYTEPIVHTDDGEFGLYYYAEDNAGNVEEVNGPFELKKDATPPTISISWDNETEIITADVADETSGIVKVEFYVNDEFVGEVTEAPWEWHYPEAAAGDTAQAIAYDEAGNSAVSASIDPVPTPQGQSAPTVVVQQVQPQNI